MNRLQYLVAGSLLLACCAAIGAEPKRLTPPASEPKHLTPDKLATAIRAEQISIPTPGELFAALEKPGKPNWTGQYRGPIPMTYRNRAQIALNLGGLIADGFVAVEAKDSQQVKNIGADIIKLSKALGVSENLLRRGNSLNDFAENDEWDAIQEELEATQNEVKSSMQTHSDQDLVILVSVGGWLRGTQVVTAAILENYDERAARVLRQPALVSFIHSKLNDISPDVRDEPLVKHVGEQLVNIEKLVGFPPTTAPSAADVRKVNEAVAHTIETIQAKTDTK